MNKIISLAALCLAGCASTADRQANLSEIRQAVAEATAAAASRAAAVPPPAPVVEAAPRPAPAREIASPRFDLVVNNAPIQQVLMGMVADTPYNMIAHPDLKGTVTLQLKNVSVPEVMQALRDLYGYDYRIDGNRVTVLSPGLRTRIFQINVPTSVRNGESEVRVISGSITDNNAANSSTGTASETIVNSTRIRTSKKNNFWEGLTASLATLVPPGEGRSVVVNPDANVLLIRAMPEEIRAVEDYMRIVQGSMIRQVVLEAKILEVQLSDGFQSGINWNALGAINGHPFGFGVGVNGNALKFPGVDTVNATQALALGGGLTGAQGRTASGLFAMALQTTDFSAMLQILGSQGSVEVLSSPRIATLNNQQAVLKVGRDEFFVTGVTTNNTSNGVTTTYSPSFTTQPFFSGVALDVTPTIDGEGHVILHIHPSVSDVSTVNKQIDLGAAGTFTLPLASSSIKETDSVVRASLGQVIAIGGLMSRTSSRNRNEVPGLGQVPLLGALFSNDATSSTKQELVILLKTSFADDDSSTLQQVSERLSTFDTGPNSLSLSLSPSISVPAAPAPAPAP
ncbi:Type II secretion system protein D [Andreprevotia sp. IGB-42]|uniref:pilus (MSHA type) biogenesis protein MshL n=1 Tax=Andreprevotia sp. IGB-42 TaxID=2497473 RepID=UPI00135B7A13|nr:pilus (MSHA type) biogenesis protein MshL [Andreprevotia sp. IGB-42]KAF0812872.1 Type II secretion system protein D [Andreprevotia sp. IGB-42]